MKKLFLLLALGLGSCVVYEVPENPSEAMLQEAHREFQNRDLVILPSDSGKMMHDSPWAANKIQRQLHSTGLFKAVFVSPEKEQVLLLAQFGTPMTLELGQSRSLGSACSMPQVSITALSLGLIPMPYSDAEVAVDFTLNDGGVLKRQGTLTLGGQTCIVGWFAWLWAPSSKWSFERIEDQRGVTPLLNAEEKHD